MLLSSENENFLFQIAGDLSNHPFFQTVTGQSEDCLSITITRPEGTSQDAKLPVLFWIYGGGFQVCAVVFPLLVPIERVMLT
jgi:carboxylesterase type B